MKNDYADFLKMLMDMRRLKMQLKKHIAGWISTPTANMWLSATSFTTS